MLFRSYSHYSMLGLGMKELEFRDDFPKQFIHAGPCCEGFDKNEYEFPDTKKYGKVIFLTSGTHVLWGKNDLVEIAKELSGIYILIHVILCLLEIIQNGMNLWKNRLKIYLSISMQITILSFQK